MKTSLNLVSATKLTLISLIIFLLESCQSGPDKKESLTEFTPNPLKLEKREVKTLNIGDAAPGFSLPDTKGIYHKLEDFKKAEVLVVIFSCNHCPTAQAYEQRMIDFTNEYKDKGVEMIVISSASVYGLGPGEQAWSDLDDSYASMQIRARDKGYNFPYL